MQREKAKHDILLPWWIFVIWRTLNWNPNFKSFKGRVVFRGHILRHSWQLRKSRMSWQGYLRAQDKHRTQQKLTPKSRWKVHRRYWKFPKVRMSGNFGCVHHDTDGQNHGPAWPDGVMEEATRESSIETRMRKKVPNWDCLFGKRWKRTCLVCACGRRKTCWREAEHRSNVEKYFFWKDVDLGVPTSFLDHVCLECTQRECETSKDIVDTCKKYVRIQDLRRRNRQMTWFGETWCTDLNMVPWYGRSCKEMRGAVLPDWLLTQLSNFPESQLPCFWWPSIQRRKIGICCIWHALVDHTFYGQWTNLKWTRAFDRRLARFISYIHYTSDFKHYCHVGNSAQQCRLGLFHDSYFAGDLEDSKSTSGGIPVYLWQSHVGSRNSMCKKQTSVSHSSTESEIISLDAGFRMDGVPAFDLWDSVIEVLHSSSNHFSKPKARVQGDLLRDTPSRKHTNNQVKTQIHHSDLELSNVDYVSSNVNSSRSGRSPTMRHRVALDWSFDRINLDPKIQIKYVDTKNQLAGVLAKGNFTRDGWNHVLRLFNMSIFQLCQVPSNDVEKDTGKNRRRKNYGKVKTSVGPGFVDFSKLFYIAEFECIERSGDTQSNQSKLEPYSMCGETLQVKIQIKPTQRRVLKCGKQMQRRTQAWRDLLLQRQTRTWTFQQVRWDLRLKVQVPSTLTQCSQTNSRYLLPASHILRKSTRIYDRKMSKIRRRHERPRCEFFDMENVHVCNVGCSSSSWKRLFGQFTFYQKKKDTMNDERQLFDVTKKLITDQTERDSRYIEDWCAHSFLAKDNFVDWHSSPIVNSKSLCVLRDWSVPWVHRRMEK